MGVDTRILLPGNVRVKTVAKILAILDGVPAIRQVMGNDGFYVHVDVKVKGIDNIPECATIEWSGASGNRYWLYHFEPEECGHRIMIPRSTAWNIAAGRRLIQFFGGKLAYTDYDRSYDETVPPKQNGENAPENDPFWSVLQERILKETPLSPEEIEDARQFAAYKDYE